MHPIRGVLLGERVPANRLNRSGTCGAVYGDTSPTRREFLTRARGGAAAILAATAVNFGTSGEAGQGARDVSNATHERVADSYEMREAAARAESQVPVPKQTTNGDEQRYPNFIGNFSKGLPHGAIGEVDPTAYRSLLTAVRQGTAAAFEQVPLGGSLKLVNPLAGEAFDLEGIDSHQLAIGPPPPVASRARAAEMVELYWMALCRDVNFGDYGSNALTTAAIAELSSLPAFAGPRSGRLVTPQTLFRGFTAGDTIGPYVSQLLLKPFRYGAYGMSGQISTYAPGLDYLTTQSAWLACQNGQVPLPSLPNQLDPAPRYIRNGRDFAAYVHADASACMCMSFYNAGIFLVANGAPLNPGNPYRNYKTQAPFTTFGSPHFLGLLSEATHRALKAVWYAKWYVHRNLRPEAFGGLVHLTKTGQKSYPLDNDVLDSVAAAGIYSKYRSYFLPQAFPEGCPQHPSYAQAHGSMAGACATVLKAAVDGNLPFTALSDGGIVTATADGLMLEPYTGADAGAITINGEIDKLASNIGLGRNFAGIHWRTDYASALVLGEAVAISILRDQSNVYAGEEFEGFSITKFDGTKITV